MPNSITYDRFLHLVALDSTRMQSLGVTPPTTWDRLERDVLTGPRSCEPFSAGGGERAADSAEARSLLREWQTLRATITTRSGDGLLFDSHRDHRRANVDLIPDTTPISSRRVIAAVPGCVGDSDLEAPGKIHGFGPMVLGGSPWALSYAFGSVSEVPLPPVLPPAALVLAASIAAGGAVVLAFTGGREARRAWRQRGVRRSGPDMRLTASELAGAPSALRSALIIAVDAAARIRQSASATEGWVTGVDVNAVVWELAQHAKIAAVLTHELAQFDDEGQDAHAAEIAESQAAIAASTAHVQSGSRRLVAIAQGVAELDAQLDEPHRRAELEAERDRRTAVAAHQAARLAEARAALDRITPTVDTAADTLAGQLDAYTDLPIAIETTVPVGSRSR